MDRPKLSRILLKLSGEAFAGEERFGLDAQTVNYIAQEVAKLHEAGVETAIVVGGGNLIRGESFSKEGGIDQSVADQMGMLGTIVNSLALQEAIEKIGPKTRVMSAVTIHAVCEPFIRRRAIRHLEKKRVVVLAAGTGSPFFTTDTAAALRALELGCDAIVKATQVDGVYDADPKKQDGAKKYETLTFEDAISRQLGVMDQTAFTMCREHNMPVIVLSIHEPGAIAAAARGEPVGTLVSGLV
ncbi:MAG: UMP kinase [Armatimonadetes bacterium]|nr:UMP kinase [Armatimonadota bacterium]